MSARLPKSAGGVLPFEKREFPLADEQFQRIRALVHKHTGISLASAKHELIYGRLVRRLRVLGLPGFADYIALLEREDAAELEQFANALTTNVTAFFREEHHFDFLAATVIPALTAGNEAKRRVRIWSAGCSSGEEPYSVAITLAQSLGVRRSWDVRILATDLDSQVVAAARAGVYSASRLEKLTNAQRQRFFRPTGEPGMYAVREELRSMVTFRQLNLLKPWPMKGPFDAIFCRNVVIYFDKQTQRDLFARLAHLQVPGGYLFIGHSESLYRVSDRYRLIGKSIYQRED
jgi:chemotaxis protein methyltransferase CheR